MWRTLSTANIREIGKAVTYGQAPCSVFISSEYKFFVSKIGRAVKTATNVENGVLSIQRKMYVRNTQVITLSRWDPFQDCWKRSMGDILACSIATALDSDINQTTGTGGHLSM